jgi:hypothetical protein
MSALKDACHHKLLKRQWGTEDTGSCQARHTRERERNTERDRERERERESE